MCVRVTLPSAASRPLGRSESDLGTMVEPEQKPTAGLRLGAPESLGISTLEPGHKPPTMPPGRQISIRVHMLDDTEEVFDVSVSLVAGI